MKQQIHIREATLIGNDSHELTHFMSLPKSATKAQQVEALRRDARWQEHHHTAIQSAIEELIQDIQRHAKENAK